MKHRNRGNVILVAIIAVVVIAAGIIGYFMWQERQRSIGHAIASGEISARGTLKNITTSEAIWRENDTDGNGINDYWTGDVSGFYRILDRAGNLVKIMDIAVARSDWAPLPPDSDGVPPEIDAPLHRAPMSKSNYYYITMRYDETGNPYQIDGPDADKNAWENPDRYGFCAFPENYCYTGFRTFIVNQDGVIWGKDLGKGVKGIDRWPGADPAAAGWGKWD